MIIVDANNQILGRLATKVAKLALAGQTVHVVNADKAVLTGKRDEIIKRYLQRIHRGIPLSGPYFPRQSDRIVRRTIRGMLPYKQDRGEQAFKRIHCHVGVPADLSDKDMMQFDNAALENSNAGSYVYIKEIATQIGGKR